MSSKASTYPTRGPLDFRESKLLRLMPLSHERKEKMRFARKMGYQPDFENPKSYSEKTNWRKLHSSNSLYVKCSDRIAVRDYVRKKIGEELLVPLLSEGESIDPAELQGLGDELVVKATHDCHSVTVIRKNGPDRAQSVCQWIESKLAVDYGVQSGEWWFSKIQPRVCVEQLLEDSSETSIPLFKFYVFKRPGDEPTKLVIEVVFESGSSNEHRGIYDENGEPVECDGRTIQVGGFPNHGTPFPSLPNFDEMRKAALALAEDFDHVTVHMFQVDGRNYFDRFSFAEDVGQSRISPRDFDYQLGQYWYLNREPGGPERPEGIETMTQKPSRQMAIKSLNSHVRRMGKKFTEVVSGAFERTLRFFALPYALACLVEWKECDRNVLLVFWDHLYIFFVLKYFPANYASCRLWEIPRKDWVYYFGTGYDPRSVRRRKRIALRDDCEIIFEDKEVCYHLCNSFGLPLPIQYGAISPDDDFEGTIRDLFENRGAERLVIKLVGGAGGTGTCLVEKQEGEIVVRKITDPLRALPLEGHSMPTRAVIQEWVTQHSAVNDLSPRALNTVRLVTMYTPEKEVIIVGAYIRVGIGSNFLDSGTHGGVGIKVNAETGQLGPLASDGRGRFYDFKPDVYDKQSDCFLPQWDEALDIARRTQECFAPFNRFIGMDIGFSESGPVLVEVNDIFDCGRFESVTGPILRNEAVLDCCKKYGMLTHNRLG